MTDPTVPRIVIRVAGSPPQPFAQREVTFGTAEHCDVRLGAGADPVHCILARTRHGYVLEDLRSSGGTYVDNRPVQQAFVEPGQVLRAGDTVFSLVDPAAVAGEFTRRTS